MANTHTVHIGIITNAISERLVSTHAMRISKKRHYTEFHLKFPRSKTDSSVGTMTAAKTSANHGKTRLRKNINTKKIPRDTHGVFFILCTNMKKK